MMDLKATTIHLVETSAHLNRSEILSDFTTGRWLAPLEIDDLSTQNIKNLSIKARENYENYPKNP